MPQYGNKILHLEMALDLALPKIDRKKADDSSNFFSKLREAREQNFPEIQNKIEELWERGKQN